MLLYVEQDIAIFSYQKVEPHIIIYTSLPYPLSLVIFLGTERRVANISEEKSDLLPERVFNFWRKLSKRTIKSSRRLENHLSRCPINSSTVVKGPETRPATTSRNAVCNPRGNFLGAGLAMGDSLGMIYARRVRISFSRIPTRLSSSAVVMQIL